MVEWFKALVLKTSEGQPSVGSNPTPSAIFEKVMNIVWSENSIAKFLDILASNEPTPGGGGASALVGAVAAALGSMMANLTLGKSKFAAVEKEVTLLEGELQVSRAEFLKLVDEDAKAYNGVMECYHLPKTTEAEQILRHERLAKAAQFAALVPLRIAEHCVKAATLTERIAQIGNPALLTDAACSVILAAAALECAEQNVLVNLPLTHNEDFNKDCRTKLKQYKESVQNSKNKTLRPL